MQNVGKDKSIMVNFTGNYDHKLFFYFYFDSDFKRTHFKQAQIPFYQKYVFDAIFSQLFVTSRIKLRAH